MKGENAVMRSRLFCCDNVRKNSNAAKLMRNMGKWMDMKPVQVTTHVDENGKLNLDQLPTFQPGEELRVLIMNAADINALEKMMEIVARSDAADPELLAQLEALDEALWDMQFANSQDTLAKLAEQALGEHRQGKTVALDIDELNRKDS